MIKKTVVFESDSGLPSPYVEVDFEEFYNLVFFFPGEIKGEFYYDDSRVKILKVVLVFEYDDDRLDREQRQPIDRKILAYGINRFILNPDSSKLTSTEVNTPGGKLALAYQSISELITTC